MFLTPEELVELTHAKRRDTQIRAQRMMGIEFKLRPNGRPAVLRSHIEKVFGGVQTQGPVVGSLPNFAALDDPQEPKVAITQQLGRLWAAIRQEGAP